MCVFHCKLKIKNYCYFFPPVVRKTTCYNTLLDKLFLILSGLGFSQNETNIDRKKLANVYESFSQIFALPEDGCDTVLVL